MTTEQERDQALAHVNGFVHYMDAKSLTEFLERVAKEDRVKVIDLMQEFNAATSENLDEW